MNQMDTFFTTTERDKRLMKKCSAKAKKEALIVMINKSLNYFNVSNSLAFMINNLNNFPSANISDIFTRSKNANLKGALIFSKEKPYYFGTNIDNDDLVFSILNYLKRNFRFKIDEINGEIDIITFYPNNSNKVFPYCYSDNKEKLFFFGDVNLNYYNPRIDIESFDENYTFNDDVSTFITDKLSELVNDIRHKFGLSPEHLKLQIENFHIADDFDDEDYEEFEEDENEDEEGEVNSCKGNCKQCNHCNHEEEEESSPEAKNDSENTKKTSNIDFLKKERTLKGNKTIVLAYSGSTSFFKNFYTNYSIKFFTKERGKKNNSVDIIKEILDDINSGKYDFILIQTTLFDEISYIINHYTEDSPKSIDIIFLESNIVDNNFSLIQSRIPILKQSLHGTSDFNEQILREILGLQSYLDYINR